MPVGIAIGVAGVAGAGASIYGANKASKAAESAANQNAQIQQQQYVQTRTDLQPYTQGGYSALDALSQYYGLTPSNGGPTYGGQGGTRIDYNALLDDNPDVQAWASQDADPTNDAEQAKFWLDNYGKNDVTTGLRPGLKTLADPYERPAYGARPTAPSAPDAGGYFSGYAPSQQYKDELAQTTRGVNAAKSATGGYFSGGRALALQDNADRLYQKDYGDWWNRQNTLYQSALGQYNNDRNYANTNYDIDTSRLDARFDTDRGYLTSRTDNRTNDLFRILTVGSGATSALAGAGQNYANGMTQNNNALAGAQGNAAIAGANGVNNALAQGLQAYGMFTGGGGQSGSLYGSNTMRRI